MAKQQLKVDQDHNVTKNNFYELTPLNEKKIQIAKHVEYSQKSVWVNASRFTNLHWARFKLNMTKVSIENKVNPHPLIEFINKDYKQFKPIAAINAGSFYYTNSGPNLIHPGYGLHIIKGVVVQPPVNTRPVILSRKNKLAVLTIEAKGYLKIGKDRFRWVSVNLSNNEIIHDSLLLYGSFYVPIRTEYRGGKQWRYVLKDDTFVHCGKTELLLGVRYQNDKLFIRAIGMKLSLVDNLFIIKGNKTLLSKISVNDQIKFCNISDLTTRDTDNGVCGIFMFDMSYAKTIKYMKQQLLKVNGKIVPLSKNYKKAWSVLLVNKDEAIVLICDADPKNNKCNGLSFKELHGILNKDFKYEYGICLDSGQTSKLCVSNNGNKEIYGNLHYRKYFNDHDEWDGTNGRYVPSALVIYE